MLMKLKKNIKIDETGITLEDIINQLSNLGSTTLYSDASGAPADVNLSDNKNNYSYLEIEYGNSGLRSFKRVYTTASKFCLEYMDSDGKTMKTKVYTLNDTKLTAGNGYYANTTDNQYYIGGGWLNVYKVIGYK